VPNVRQQTSPEHTVSEFGLRLGVTVRQFDDGEVWRWARRRGLGLQAPNCAPGSRTASPTDQPLEFAINLERAQNQGMLTTAGIVGARLQDAQLRRQNGKEVSFESITSSRWTITIANSKVKQLVRDRTWLKGSEQERVVKVQALPFDVKRCSRRRSSSTVQLLPSFEPYAQKCGVAGSFSVSRYEKVLVPRFSSH